MPVCPPTRVRQISTTVEVHKGLSVSAWNPWLNVVWLGNAECQSLNTRGLYPAGEGAGYASGILSAVVDGIKMAEQVAVSISLLR